MFRILISFVMSITCVPLCAQVSGPVGADSVLADEKLSEQNSPYYKGQLYTSVKDRNKILITWPSLDSIDVDYFSLERKTNESNFEFVGIIKHDSTSKNYQWLDEGATVGKHLYRLYVVTAEGEKVLLAVSQVILSGATDIKFYPNPVDNVLIIRSSYPLDVVILDGQGMIKVPMFKVNGLYTLPVSQLEKGIYYIRFQNKLTGLVSQERLVKN